MDNAAAVQAIIDYFDNRFNELTEEIRSNHREFQSLKTEIHEERGRQDGLNILARVTKLEGDSTKTELGFQRLEALEKSHAELRKWILAAVGVVLVAVLGAVLASVGLK